MDFSIAQYSVDRAGKTISISGNTSTGLSLYVHGPIEDPSKEKEVAGALIDELAKAAKAAIAKF